VDHIVVAQSDERFRKAYAQASLALADGVPVLWAARLLGVPLPAKVSGSDLVMPLMRRAAERGFRVYFLGGAPGVAARAAEKLRVEIPNVQIVGTDSPQIKIDQDPEERAKILERIKRAAPDIVLVALGAPKQEIFSEESREALSPAVLICVGASLDFIAGVAKRAPAWISKVGFEWLYRLAQEPKRLASRYLLRDPEFFLIVARQFMNRPRTSEAAQKS
jgi:N-acetylglucosaminyldiphosphoundecaprenol N-acetyl-beta-D-mannosaminyltransferase